MEKTYLVTKLPCWNQTFAKPCTAVLAAFAAAKDGQECKSASRLSAALCLSVRSALSQQPSRCELQPDTLKAPMSAVEPYMQARLMRPSSMSIPSMLRHPKRDAIASVSTPSLQPMSRQRLFTNQRFSITCTIR